MEYKRVICTHFTCTHHPAFCFSQINTVFNIQFSRFIYPWERETERERREGQREREKIPSRLPTECGAQREVWSHNPEIPEIKGLKITEEKINTYKRNGLLRDWGGESIYLPAPICSSLSPMASPAIPQSWFCTKTSQFPEHRPKEKKDTGAWGGKLSTG